MSKKPISIWTLEVDGEGEVEIPILDADVDEALDAALDDHEIGKILCEYDDRCLSCGRKLDERDTVSDEPDKWWTTCWRCRGAEPYEPEESEEPEEPAARPLSDLQRFILRAAYENFQSGKKWSDGSDLDRASVFEGFYRWERVRTGWHGGAVFSAGEIGARQYHAAQAAVGKSFGRLETRGLVERTAWGIKLTADGAAVTKQLVEAEHDSDG